MRKTLFREKGLSAKTMLCLLLWLITSQVFSQITINVQNQPLVEALKAIERASNYRFFYNETLPELKKSTTVRLTDSDIDNAMRQILAGTNIDYSKSDNNIIALFHKEVPEQQPPTSDQRKGSAVKGNIVDAYGEPVIGATVVDKNNPTVGTVTDIDGNYLLNNVAANASLQFSYVGMITKTVPVNGRTVINIVMESDSELLEEVVVVGYGTQRKINLTGSVSQIDNSILENRPIQNVSSALQGVMPGVMVTSGQGRPGQDDSTIRIRGVGTLNTADPYILVDGIETGTMNSVDPNDIESISVLKDAASAAIYGSKASNGVILITTKRGKTGKPRITYNGYLGMQKPTELIDRMGSYNYARLYNQSLVDNGLSPRFSDAEIELFKNGTDSNYPNTKWYDEAYKTGIQHSHNVNLSGGTEEVKYMGSVGYLEQRGILPNSERQQFNGRTNLDMKLTPQLGMRLNLAYIKNDYSDPVSSYAGGSSDQIIRQLNRIAPWIVNRYDDGSYGTISDGNPIAWLDANQTVDRDNQNFSGTLSADYKLIDGLVATLTGSYVDNSQHYRDFQKYIRYNANKETEPNHLDERYYKWNRSTFDALLNWDKQSGAHGLKAMGGWHAEKYNYSYSRSYRRDFPSNDLTDMNAGDPASQLNEGYTRKLAMLSWFGRVNYDYAGKYLFEANIRSDASSRFSEGHRWGYFPSISGAWRLSEESFMENSKRWIDDLKIRASWGSLGNQDALDDYYPWMNTYALGATYPFGGALNSGYYQDSYKLSTITWEKARTWGIGVDATINQKLTATIDYYDRKTTGIIMDVPVPEEFGLGAYKDNVGSMVNRGVEVMLSYFNTWGDWSLNVSGNVTYNKNKILDLGGVSTMVDPNNSNKRRVVGEALNTYYVYVSEGFFDSDATAQEWMNKYAGQDGYPFGNRVFKGGDLIYKDVDRDGKITANDRKLAGSTDPSVTFGLNINAGYKDFDLSMIFTGAADVHRLINQEVTGYFNGDDSHPASVWLDAWRPDNKKAKMPRIAYSTTSPSLSSNVMSTFWLQNATYLRMKNLQVGYTLPQKIIQHIGAEKIRVYYSAENLFTIHDMLVNVDPEISSERASNFPLTRTQAIGVNITF